MAEVEKSQFGMIGMAVMGRNLALNILDHGTSVAVYNREPELTKSAVESVRVLVEPMQRRLCRRDSEVVFFDSGDGAIVEYLAVIVTPTTISDLPDGELA